MAHLTPDQFVDALDGALPPDRQAHVDVCDACRAELAALRSAIALAETDCPVEPSPLFWDHLETRVRTAVDASAVAPLSQAWWAGWRLATAACVTVAALGLAVWVQWASRLPDTSNRLGAGFNVAQALADGLSPAAAGETGADPARSRDVTPAAAPGARGNTSAWQAVVQRAAELPADNALVTPALTGSAVMLEELSQRELREFVRLLKAEMGGM